MRIAIANRGEIARRIIRTVHRLGHQSIALYADPDRHAPFVSDARFSQRIGPAELGASYLNIDAVISGAQQAGADALHPGYGFLSERADAAQAVIDAGLIWIGPQPEIIELMGSKIEARHRAAAAGVSIIPGFDTSQDADALAAAAAEIGYPVLIKAAAGGGGKGIRVVADPTDFLAVLVEARSEAERSFGDSAVIVERYIARPRHIEVQILGDQHGHVIHLGTRECSVQRRYQKLFEEAPAPNLDQGTYAAITEQAVALAQAVGYDSAGTVEFVVDQQHGEPFFLEMNTRLQVEHPVTEEITGIDLVEAMIALAQGEPLAWTQDKIRFDGHAVEARIAAEDTTAGFMPQTGQIRRLHIPDGVRWESGVEEGSEIPPQYDSMVAKLIVHRTDRSTALDDLATALDELIIGGVGTTAGLHRWLLDTDAMRNATITTRFLDEAELPDDDGRDTAATMAVTEFSTAATMGEVPRPAGQDRAAAGIWHTIGAFTPTPYTVQRTISLQHHSGEVFDRVIADGVAPVLPGSEITVNVGGYHHHFVIMDPATRWAPSGRATGVDGGEVLAPFPAVVAETPVGVGDDVERGEVVIVIEAMKMLHSLRAPITGTIAHIAVRAGEQIKSNDVLVLIEPDGSIPPEVTP